MAQKICFIFHWVHQKSYSDSCMGWKRYYLYSLLRIWDWSTHLLHSAVPHLQSREHQILLSTCSSGNSFRLNIVHRAQTPSAVTEYVTYQQTDQTFLPAEISPCKWSQASFRWQYRPRLANSDSKSRQVDEILATVWSKDWRRPGGRHALEMFRFWTTTRHRRGNSFFWIREV